MYIYGKPHTPGPGDERDAERDSARPAQRSSSHGPGPVTHARPLPPTSNTSTTASPGPGPNPVPSPSGPKSRRKSLPVTFPFPPLFQPNTSSTSLAPSTAEGRPVPLDNTTAAHRISALQKLNSTYPSSVRRHRYAKSTGAQSSTYSQPVLVRTYTGPPPSQSLQGARNSRYRPSSGNRGNSRRVPLPSSSRQSTSSLSGRPSQPALSGTAAGNDHSSRESGSRVGTMNMPRHKHKKPTSKLPISLPLPWQWQSSFGREQDEARLPPLEAFSFKSFMAEMQARGGDDDIGADLDRIAEICARSRYSLSNQYEVHVAPHGSGESFATGPVPGGRRRAHTHIGGPTLQAFNSEDDESAAARSHRKRRSGGRRKSVAYGTLETIMSSSRSSEEDQAKKKPAAEIANELRGRAGKKTGDSSTGAATKSHDTPQDSTSPDPRPKGNLLRKKSSSFATAVIDSGRSVGKPDGASSLISEPALPHTSNTNLSVRTAPDGPNGEGSPRNSRSGSPEQRQVEVHLADDLPHEEDQKVGSGEPRAAWSAWMPWRSHPKSDPPQLISGRDPSSHAEGSLRQLLKGVDINSDKGKAIEREG
ncbi:hypothetical protein QBC39DRAFT_128020 [Podospora conica]|nr:hypothetical protein QBC39DRAFT_128020 [Schizothecium conicum]